MRLLSILFISLFLLNCQSQENSTSKVIAPINTPEQVATDFIKAVFEQKNTQLASSFAMGELKEKILNQSEQEAAQLNMIESFSTSNIKTETKIETGLSVVSMKTAMKLNNNEFTAEQNIVLKLVDNKWMVYHF